MSQAVTTEAAPAREPLSRIREWVLIAVLAWAPLPFGSARPWAWDLLGIVAVALLGLSAVNETLRPSRSSALRPLLPALVMAGLLAAWIVFQSLPWDVLGWHHPLWDRASEVVGRPLDASLAVDREASLVHLFRLLTYGGYFIVAWQVARRAEAAGAILRAVAVIGTIYALYGLIEFVSPDPRILWFIKEAYVTDVTSTFVNRNSYATFAGLTAIANLVLIANVLIRNTDLRSRKSIFLSMADNLFGRARWFVFGLIATSGSLLMSHSRGGLISALAAVFVLLVLILAAPAARGPWRKWFAGLVAVGGIAIVLLAGAATFDRLDTLSNDTEMRPKIDAAVLRAIGDNYLTGTGLGSFAEIFPLYQPLTVAGFVDMAHDDYLENALELGVPAACLLFGTVLYLAGRCVAGVFRRRRDVIYPCAAVAATVMVGVHSALDFSMQIPAVAVTYAVLLGVGVAQSVNSHPAVNSRPAASVPASST